MSVGAFFTGGFLLLPFHAVLQVSPAILDQAADRVPGLCRLVGDFLVAFLFQVKESYGLLLPCR
jgi:hypothetical protein